MLLGILLVLGSAVAGGLVLADRDRGRTYWAVREDVATGAVPSRADLEPVHVRVDDAGRPPPAPHGRRAAGPAVEPRVVA
ncbi:MAG: hypothetical protein PGN07_08240 [Aeromicrobium erythreum]